MAMTIDSNPGVTGPYDTAADYAGKEGLAASLTGAAGDEIITLVTAGTGSDAVGVIASVTGNYTDGTMKATLQLQGMCQLILGATVSAGKGLTPGTGSKWVQVASDDFMNAILLQGGEDGNVAKAVLTGTSNAVRA